MLLQSRITCVALVGGALAVASCVNSDPVDMSELGPSPSTSTSSSASASASTTTPPAMEDTTMCGGSFDGFGNVVVSPYCTNSAPVNCNIASFEPGMYVLGSDLEKWSDDTWQDTESLSGGVNHYYKDGNPPLVRALENGAMHVTGTVLAGGYAGWLYWFGPCQDASPFEGVQFTVSGSVGAASFAAQVQTDENYPINDGDTKGNCDYLNNPDYTGESGDEWNVCTNNSYTLPALTTESYSYYVPFTEFVGGKPNPVVSPNQVLAIQFQIGCPEGEDCLVDVTLYDLRFYRGHEAALGPEVPETADSAAAADSAAVPTDVMPVDSAAVPAATN